MATEHAMIRELIELLRDEENARDLAVAISEHGAGSMQVERIVHEIWVAARIDTGARSSDGWGYEPLYVRR